MNFSRGKKRKLIIAPVAPDIGLVINVERPVLASSEGEVFIDVQDDQFQLVCDTIIDYGAIVQILNSWVYLDKSECANCGTGMRICPCEFFTFDRDWKRSIDKVQYMGCVKLVGVCPSPALMLTV